MIKLVIVEDEDLLREGLVHYVDWTSLGYEVVGEAANGKDGLDIVRMTKPDIVITDIRMPIMDGITMTELLKEQDENIVVVIISGYDDFGYARRALKLGVSEYIMKPIDIELLKKTMEVLCKKITLQYTKQNELVKLKGYEQYNRQKLMENAFNDIIQDIPMKGINENFLAELEDLYFCIGICEKENFPIVSIDCDYLQLMEMDRQFEQRIYSQIHINEHPENVACIKMNTCERILCMWGSRKEEAASYARFVLSNFQQNYSDAASVTLSLGEIHKGKAGLRKSFSDARNKHNENYLIIWNNIIHEESNKDNTLEYMNYITDKLFETIKAGDRKSIDLEFEKFEAELNKNKILSYIQTVLLASNMLKEIMKLPEEIGGSSVEIFGDPMDFYMKIVTNTKRSEVLDCLKEACYIVNDYFQDIHSGKLAGVFKRAVNYMQKEYTNEDLMLKDVAKNAFISSSYLSVIIKKETGKTFIEYLTDIRMEQARILLIETNKKSYEIAEECGFSNPTYFSTVFKGVYGVSPSVFRKNNGKCRE